MATNPYINNYRASGEQKLLESLIIESIKMYGRDVFYLPRTRHAYDPLYGQDDISSFDKAIPLEMYIKNYGGFQGDGIFLGKFGLEIRDQITFTVAKRRFIETVGDETGEVVPAQGDLIFLPLANRAYTILSVDYKPTFYMLDELQTYDLTCELFEYSNETMNTGIRNIDLLRTEFTTNIFIDTLEDENGHHLQDENGDWLTASDPAEFLDSQYSASDNSFVQAEADLIIDFSDMPPELDKIY
jgi:hypothetical protein